jgi:outer membrane protein assembly factor BamD
MRRTLLALALATALPACSTKYTTVSGNLKLGATAEENYQRGLEEAKHHNFPEAVRFFDYVKAKYPFSKVSALSELRIADIKFDQGRWVEASDGYEKFVKDHPSSEEIDYAHFRAGVAHLKAAPSDFILFPPVEEKDQRETEKALASLRDFVQRRPDSKYLPEARKALTEATDRLASREMYAGDYYFKRERWAGAAGRYQGLVTSYPEASTAEVALLKLARAYARMGEKFKARQALQQLIAQHPESRERPQAERLLESLR